MNRDYYYIIVMVIYIMGSFGNSNVLTVLQSNICPPSQG
jgi:hypothetical protein